MLKTVYRSSCRNQFEVNFHIKKVTDLVTCELFLRVFAFVNITYRFRHKMAPWGGQYSRAVMVIALLSVSWPLMDLAILS